MKMRTTFKATTTAEARHLQGAGRRVVLEDTGNGFYLLHRISDISDPSRMVNVSRHATIWIRTGEFTTDFFAVGSNGQYSDEAKARISDNAN